MSISFTWISWEIFKYKTFLLLADSLFWDLGELLLLKMEIRYGKNKNGGQEKVISKNRNFFKNIREGLKKFNYFGREYPVNGEGCIVSPFREVNQFFAEKKCVPNARFIIVGQPD